VNPGLIDLEGDGDLDIVSFRPPLPPGFGGDSEVLINDGSGHFTLDPSDQFLVRGRSNGGVSYLDAADMDGDGDADLLASDGCGYPSPPGHQAYFLNTTRHVWAETRPTRGETWRLTVGGRPGGLAVLALAFAKNRGISLPPFGTLALDPSATLLWPRVLAFDLERVAFVDLPIPDLPALGGLPLFAQALCIEPNGRARFSNLWIEDAIR
ncbi:MAG: VCBS repeat-containing protein, partial [Planctomycetes bacterium]|nr:VCBS repeat-containing protein [Planctomycetota bacterium]